MLMRHLVSMRLSASAESAFAQCAGEEGRSAKLAKRKQYLSARSLPYVPGDSAIGFALLLRALISRQSVAWPALKAPSDRRRF